jgi:hypothetical protein
MNFAFSDDSTSYHTPLDTADRLDLDSVQHMGTYALSLARRFGSVDLPLQAAADVVYFEVARGVIVRYPVSWVLPLTGLLMLVCAVVIVLECRRRAADVIGMALGIVGFVAMVVSAAALAKLVLMVVGRLDGAVELLREPYGATWYRVGLTLMALAAGCAGYRLLRLKLSARNIALAALSVWCGLLAMASVVAPETSYYFAWPLLSALIGAGLSRLAQRRGSLWLELGSLLVIAAPIVAVVVPGPYLLYVGLQLQRGTVGATSAALALAVLLPHLEFVGGGRSWRPAATIFAAGIIVFAAALWSSGYSHERPRPACLAYELDASKQQAAWITTDVAVPETYEPYFEREAAATGIDPYQDSIVERRSQAPTADLAPPRISVLGDVRDGQNRRLRLHLDSQRGAHEISLFVMSPTVVQEAIVDGQRVTEQPPYVSSTSQPWGFRYIAARSSGIELELSVTGGAPVELRIIDRSYALPPAFVSSPPPDVMSFPFYVAGSAFVSASYRFD